MSAEGLARLWWTPTDCSGAKVQILLSSVTYDITPPTLAVIADIGKYSVTLAQTSAQTDTAVPSSPATHSKTLRRNSRRLQGYTLQATGSSPVYGADVMFNFSEPVLGFGPEYAFVKGGALSSSGLNMTVSQQQYTAIVLAYSTAAPLLMVKRSQ